MASIAMSDKTASSIKSGFAIILVNPEKPENVGLVARAMKNTGFSDLRFVGLAAIEERSFITAVHAKEILESGRFFSNLEQAVADCGVVYAATSKARKDFASLALDTAVDRILSSAGSVKTGLVFGNERTGLTSLQLRRSNFRFFIPQAAPQPSYNLAAAVLITLFQIFRREPGIHPESSPGENPMPREGQEECLRRLLSILEEKSFIHENNRRHIQARIYDLFGRMALTEKDKDLLLALFSKGISPRR